MRKRFKRKIQVGDVLVPHVDFDPATALAVDISKEDVSTYWEAYGLGENVNANFIALSEEENVLMKHLYPPMRKRIKALREDGCIRYIVLRIS